MNFALVNIAIYFMIIAKYDYMMAQNGYICNGYIENFISHKRKSCIR